MDRTSQFVELKISSTDDDGTGNIYIWHRIVEVTPGHGRVIKVEVVDNDLRGE